MTNLFIDFDGVILDTIEATKRMALKDNINIYDEEVARDFYTYLNWEELIKDNLIINNSINSINKIIKSNKFNVSILTHVNSLKEAEAKINYIRKYFKDITIIPVPIFISKTKMVQTVGSILIDDRIKNLEEWKNEGGIAIYFSKIKNDIFKTIYSLDEILEII